METMTQDEVKRLLEGEHVPRKSRHSVPLTHAKCSRRERGTMNKTERRYADELNRLERAGLIRWWEFEAVKIRLADNTFITPDFAVIAADGFLEFHDTKGTKGDGYWCEEDAKIKLKILAERFPARVKIVWLGNVGVGNIVSHEAV